MSRERAEAVVLLGRDVVEAAFAEQDKARAFFRQHPKEVRDAVEGILARLGNIPEAVAFARTLTPELGRAIAAAWAADAGEQVISELLEEDPMKPRGGKREGAGRKPKLDKKVSASFTLPPEYVKALGDYAKKRRMSRSEAILELLKAAGILEVRPADKEEADGVQDA